MGISSFDNVLDAAILVWQVITLEGWTNLMYITEITTTELSSAYFIIIVMVGSFFLVNLTLAVITIFFIESQNKFRKQIQQAKAKSQEELERSYKISNFAKIGYQRILIVKDSSISAKFSRVYKKLKQSVFTQGFYEKLTDGKVNKVPKGSKLKHIKSLIPIHY